MLKRPVLRFASSKGCKVILTGACGWTDSTGGVKRRQRWRTDETLRIIAETEHIRVVRGLGTSVRDQPRPAVEPAPADPTRRAGAVAKADVMPVLIAPDPLPVLPSSSPAQVTSPAEDARVENTLPDGTCVRVGTCVGLANLRRIMTAVRR